MIKSKIVYTLKWIFYTFLIFRIVIFLIQLIFKLTIIGLLTLPIINIIIVISLLIIAKDRWEVIAFPIASLLIIATIFNFVLKLDTKELYFNSPNNKNTLIVHEVTALRGGYCKYYKKKFLIFKQNLNIDTYSDEMERPFTYKHSTLHWVNDNEVILNITGRIKFKDLDIKFDE